MLVDGDFSLELALLSGNGSRCSFLGVAVRCSGASAVRNCRDDRFDDDRILLRFVCLTGNCLVQRFHVENFLRF